MRICEDGHIEICYEGFDCPICVPETGKERLSNLVGPLLKGIRVLQDEVRQQYVEITRLRRDISHHKEDSQ